MTYENLKEKILEMDDMYYKYCIVEFTETKAEIIVHLIENDSKKVITPGSDIFDLLAEEGFYLRFIGTETTHEELYLNFTRIP